jgi:GNAT superfamily N-acetyltransferase
VNHSFDKHLQWEQLYDFYATALSRTPDMAGIPPWTEQQVKKLLFESPDARPEWIWLALVNNQWVGLTVLVRTRADTYNLLTSVEPEARGHGLAIALKLHAIAAAKKAGFSWMRTNNLSTNLPMLAINRKLGFQSNMGRWLMRLAFL